MRTMEDREGIKEVEKTLQRRFDDWRKFFDGGTRLKFLISNRKAQSITVIPVKGDPEYIEHVKAAAKKNGLLLGGGYGTYKKETFRIANFPALKNSEIARLKKFLKSYR